MGAIAPAMHNNHLSRVWVMFLSLLLSLGLFVALLAKQLDLVTLLHANSDILSIFNAIFVLALQVFSFFFLGFLADRLSFRSIYLFKAIIFLLTICLFVYSTYTGFNVLVKAPALLLVLSCMSSFGVGMFLLLLFRFIGYYMQGYQQLVAIAIIVIAPSLCTFAIDEVLQVTWVLQHQSVIFYGLLAIAIPLAVITQYRLRDYQIQDKRIGYWRSILTLIKKPRNWAAMQCLLALLLPLFVLPVYYPELSHQGLVKLNSMQIDHSLKYLTVGLGLGIVLVCLLRRYTSIRNILYICLSGMLVSLFIVNREVEASVLLSAGLFAVGLFAAGYVVVVEFFLKTNDRRCIGMLFEFGLALVMVQSVIISLGISSYAALAGHTYQHQWELYATSLSEVHFNRVVVYVISYLFIMLMALFCKKPKCQSALRLDQGGESVSVGG